MYLTTSIFYSDLLQVTACLSSYYELRPCRPRTEKLRKLLEECPYRGPEYENGGQEFERGEWGAGDGRDDWEGQTDKKRRKKNKEQPRKVCIVASLSNYSLLIHSLCSSTLKQYTFSDLLSVVQASERELQDALEKLQACLVDGIHLWDLHIHNAVWTNIQFYLP